MVGTVTRTETENRLKSYEGTRNGPERLAGGRKISKIKGRCEKVKKRL